MAPASAAERPGGLRLTALSGLAELRLTSLALRQLATRGIKAEAVPPATPVLAADGRTVAGFKMVPEYTAGTIDAAGRPGEGSGRAKGGVVLANDKARMEISGIRGELPDGRVFASLKIGDRWVGELPLYRMDVTDLRLSLGASASGQPIGLRGEGIAMMPTKEGLDAFAEAFGTVLFGTGDIVFTASVRGDVYPVPAEAS
ncbi:hypothetical protein ACQKM2_38225 [Streptomyces sp. NPDC004126]|uniref:hypothetical protein n=1 Tax=Streptomyces sp. NPDC004126 TaxID=3390695 RepID=UPI003D023055